MISLSIKLKTIDEAIDKEKYDCALAIIKKNKNSRINKKNVRRSFIEKEMIIYWLLNKRQEFDIAKNELYNSNIYGYKAEFWNIMFYFMNDKENPELDNLLENYKHKYPNYTGLINYLNILQQIKNGNLGQAQSDYESISKKIKTKILKKYIESILY